MMDDDGTFGVWGLSGGVMCILEEQLWDFDDFVQYSDWMADMVCGFSLD